MDSYTSININRASQVQLCLYAVIIFIFVLSQEIVPLELYHCSVLSQRHTSTDSSAAHQPNSYEPVPPVLRKSTFSSMWAFIRQLLSVASKLIVLLLLSCKLLCSDAEVTERSVAWHGTSNLSAELRVLWFARALGAPAQCQASAGGGTSRVGFIFPSQSFESYSEHSQDWVFPF